MVATFKQVKYSFLIKHILNLDGFVNKRNLRICVSENPHVCVPQSLYTKRIIYGQIYPAEKLLDPFSYMRQRMPVITFEYCINLWSSIMPWKMYLKHHGSCKMAQGLI